MLEKLKSDIPALTGKEKRRIWNKIKAKNEKYDNENSCFLYEFIQNLYNLSYGLIAINKTLSYIIL